MPTLRPMNRCIYCGKVDSPETLTDEHIIPFGLNGDVVLPKSSCVECAHITGTKFEQEVLRGMLIGYRTHNNFKTRNKKTKPRELPIIDDVQSKTERISLVNLDEHPNALILPSFDMPGFFTGAGTGSRINLLGTDVWNLRDVVEKLARRGGRPAYFQTFSPGPFCRMLAKIAHGFAEDKYRDTRWTPFLNGIILGSDDNISEYIGSAIGDCQSTNSEHTISFDVIEGTIITYIQLFSKISRRKYIVVTGKLWREH